MSHLRTFLTALALVSGAAPGLAACTLEGAAPAGESDHAGSVSLALSAVGPDGATYALQGAGMNVSWTANGASGSTSLYFNASGGTQSFTVPVGNYTATLFGGTPDAQAGWTLTRAGDGGATTVSAALLDPQPYTFAITNGGTTNLALHFAIAGVGNVVFAAGTLTTSLSVDAGTFPASHALVAGSATFTSIATPGLPALASLLNVNAASPPTVPLAIATNLTSGFTFAPGQACASVVGTVVGTLLPDGGVEDSLADFADEMSGGSGYLCFLDPGGFRLTLQRQGLAVTAPFQSALGATASDVYTFEVSGPVSPPILVNGTLALSALAQPTALTGAQVSLGVQPGFGQSGAGATAFSAPVTLQITP